MGNGFRRATGIVATNDDERFTFFENDDVPIFCDKYVTGDAGVMNRPTGSAAKRTARGGRRRRCLLLLVTGRLWITGGTVDAPVKA